MELEPIGGHFNLVCHAFIANHMHLLQGLNCGLLSFALPWSTDPGRRLRLCSGAIRSAGPEEIKLGESRRHHVVKLWDWI